MRTKVDQADRELMRRAYSELHDTLSDAPGPLGVSRAYQKHRRAIYTDAGHEGPAGRGPGAAYHLQDAVGILRSAAEVLSTDDLSAVQNRKRPTQALRVLMYAHGWRYVRGIEGVADAVAQRLPRELPQFLESRAKFEADFSIRVMAAHITNEHGECPAAVFKVLQMFAGEMHELALWLDRVGDPGRAMLMRADLQSVERALHKFHETPNRPVPGRRPRRNTHWG